MHLSSHVLAKCWVLAGPTAAGKSAVALELAELLGAEIIALDSMTLYRGMDIGTAKPSPGDQARIPHHLLDLIEPHEEFSVAEYLTAAARVCDRILERNRIPLFVGGTGLYLRSLLRGIFEGPSADWALRQRLETLEQSGGIGTLHARLSQIDPETSGRLHPNDLRRIIRALEVHELTGIPLSQLQSQAELPVELRPRHVYWLDSPRDWLYKRIDARVLAMIDSGLATEVKALMRLPNGIGRTAQQALGYKEILDHLAGRTSLTEAIETIQTRSRQFAKRQITWFSNLPECHAVTIQGDEQPSAIAKRLLSIT